MPRIVSLAFACALLAAAPVWAQTPAPTLLWAPKPTATPAYPAGHKPWIKLADLKAKHKGEPAWREVVVDDGRLMAEYVAAPPGTKVSPRLHPDTREWFAVVEGEVRVEIEGQAPIRRDARIARQHPAADDLLTRDRW